MLPLYLGGIPPEIGTLIHTLVLDLKFNDLQGYLPTELGMLPNLVELHLNSNSFTGSVHMLRICMLLLQQTHIVDDVPNIVNI